MVRTKACGAKKAIWLGSSSDRAPSERNGQTGSGVKPDRKWSQTRQVRYVRGFCLTQEQQKYFNCLK